MPTSGSTCVKRLLFAVLCSCLASAASANPIGSTMAAANSTRPGTASASSSATNTEWLICAKQDAETRANCSVATEKLLLQNSTNDLEALLYEFMGPYAETYKQSYESVISTAIDILTKSERDVQTWLNEVNPSVYDNYKSQFDKFYMQLNLYVRTTVPLLRGRMYQKPAYSVSPAESARHIFRTFLVELTEDLATSSPTLPTAVYIECVVNMLNNGSLCSRLPDTTHVRQLGYLLSDSFIEPLERSLIVIRTWLNVLLVITKFTKDINSQTPITEECIRAFGAVKMCSRCSSSLAMKPCRQTCELVAQICLSRSTDFATNWINFIESAERYSSHNDLAYALYLLPELLDKFSRELTNILGNITTVDFEPILSDPVFASCTGQMYTANDALFVQRNITTPLTDNSSVISNDRQLAEQPHSSSSLINKASGMFQSLEYAIVGALCDQSSLESDCRDGERQLRTNPRNMQNDQFGFYSAVNYTQRLAESVDHNRQFYSDYALLFRDYTGQIRTGGMLSAGHTLTNDYSTTGDRALPCEPGEPDCPRTNPDETLDDEFGDDEFGSGNGAPNSDDEDDFSGADIDGSGLEGSADGCKDQETDCTSDETTKVVTVTSPAFEEDSPKPTLSTDSVQVQQSQQPQQPQPQEPQTSPQPQPKPPKPQPTDSRDAGPQKPRTSAATRMDSSYPLNLFIFYATFAVLFHLPV